MEELKAVVMCIKIIVQWKFAYTFKTMCEGLFSESGKFEYAQSGKCAWEL